MLKRKGGLDQTNPLKQKLYHWRIKKEKLTFSTCPWTTSKQQLKIGPARFFYMPFNKNIDMPAAKTDLSSQLMSLDRRYGIHLSASITKNTSFPLLPPRSCRAGLTVDRCALFLYNTCTFSPETLLLLRNSK